MWVPESVEKNFPYLEREREYRFVLVLCQDGIRKSMRSCDFKESLGFGDFLLLLLLIQIGKKGMGR